MIRIEFGEYPFKFQNRENGRFIFDIIRKKFVKLTPEEWVRQNLLHYLTSTENYPKGLISVEKEIRVNQLKKRYDIVVFGKDRAPWMLIECKEAKVAVTQSVLEQVLRYYQVVQCPYWLISNGIQHFCAQIHDGKITWLDRFPTYQF